MAEEEKKEWTMAELIADLEAKGKPVPSYMRMDPKELDELIKGEGRPFLEPIPWEEAEAERTRYSREWYCEGGLHDARTRAEKFHEYTAFDGAKYKLPWPVTDILEVERDIYPMGPLGYNETIGQISMEDMQGDPQETVRVQFWNGDDLMMKWEDLKLVGAASSYKCGRDIAVQKKRENRLGINKNNGIRFLKTVENHGF